MYIFFHVFVLYHLFPVSETAKRKKRRARASAGRALRDIRILGSFFGRGSNRRSGNPVMGGFPGIFGSDNDPG